MGVNLVVIWQKWQTITNLRDCGWNKHLGLYCKLKVVMDKDFFIWRLLMYLEPSEPWVKPVHFIVEENSTVEDFQSQEKELKMGCWTIIMEVLPNLPLSPWIDKVIWRLFSINMETGEMRSAMRKGQEPRPSACRESGVLRTARSMSLRIVCICSQRGYWLWCLLCYRW